MIDATPDSSVSEIPKPLHRALVREARRAYDPRVGGGDLLARMDQSFAWCALLVLLYVAAEALTHEGATARGATLQEGA